MDFILFYSISAIYNPCSILIVIPFFLWLQNNQINYVAQLFISIKKLFYNTNGGTHKECEKDTTFFQPKILLSY
jgi:hypothetical protein